ncbi:hypothetical protein K461DRAFT_288568 [Myriangium duriaei CBS 260.36]|uniref:Uncharacterized protein n=1 Tax=Myriangium duriaei CBS 260.36 TaxID=1168546 RepID=A0A9P4IX50_9PEZI|nr:hypothetical protein K461DRAFT_288568 [Myriangium duriaei CBS 260.36]
MTAQTTVQERRPRALAEIGYNAFYLSESGTSDDDTSSPLFNQEQNDVQSIVGVSLGPEQKRLTLPDTPAVEKSAAIEAGGGFFGPDQFNSLDDVAETSNEQEEEYVAGPGVVDGHDSDSVGVGRASQRSTQKVPASNRLPSPWRATPRLFQKVDEHHRPAFKNLSLSRRRAATGPSLLDGWPKALMSSLPSLPKSLSFTAPFSGKKTGVTPTSNVSQSAHHSPAYTTPSSTPRRLSNNTREALSANHTDIAAGTLDQSKPPNPIARDASRPNVPAPTPLITRTSQLRRTASDESMQLRSALSRVSTLGDDTRFEDVKAQVNSRAKAIRDSFQDSNIKLPSFPSLTNLSLDSFRPDFSFANRSNHSRRFSAIPFDREGNPIPAMLSPTPSQTARGPSTKAATTHPHFTKACADMTGDLVILGGYRGSILRSAEPPHRQLWVPVKVGLNIRKVDMEVGLNVPEDDMKMESKIIPSGMLSHIGPVDISRRLFRRLRACDNATSGKLRVHDYGYDWRLDPEYLSQRLIAFLERLPCNQPGVSKAGRGATVIAHSLGGLITRNAVNKRPELFAGVIYAGTPTTCCNILGPLRNGDDVLLSSRVLTAQVNFTIRTSFALLPLDGKCFFNKETKEEFPVDFFDPQTWIDYRLTPCLARPLPPLEPPPPGMLDGLMSSFSSAMPSRTGKFSSVSFARPPTSSHGATGESTTQQRPSSPPSGGTELEPSDMDHAPSSSVATAVTIPRDQALAYLTTTLSRVKKFKQDLAFRPEHLEANVYPPTGVIYGKSVPTVYGAKVKDREAIKRSDAFDQLAFASGDGVVLARAAMLPDGYEVVKGGTVSSERGHITLLGDLEAVGRALNAVRRGRAKGMGTGIDG